MSKIIRKGLAKLFLGIAVKSAVIALWLNREYFLFRWFQFETLLVKMGYERELFGLNFKER